MKKEKTIMFKDYFMTIEENGFTLWDDKSMLWFLDASTMNKDGTLRLNVRDKKRFYFKKVKDCLSGCLNFKLIKGGDEI